RLARQCCLVAGDTHPVPLDTLAAAYAEVGSFDQAVEVARRAAGLADAAGQNDLAGQIRERSRLYEKRQPLPAAPPAALPRRPPGALPRGRYGKRLRPTGLVRVACCRPATRRPAWPFSSSSKPAPAPFCKRPVAAWSRSQ